VKPRAELSKNTPHIFSIASMAFW